MFSLLWDKRDKSGKANVIEMKSDVDPEANVANAQKALVSALINHPWLIRNYGSGWSRSNLPPPIWKDC